VGRGPNAGAEFSQEDYHHPAAGWGAARSVGKVLVESRELVAGTRAIQRMNDENGSTQKLAIQLMGIPPRQAMLRTCAAQRLICRLL
jgi:hypothetical protein